MLNSANNALATFSSQTGHILYCDSALTAIRGILAIGLKLLKRQKWLTSALRITLKKKSWKGLTHPISALFRSDISGVYYNFIDFNPSPLIIHHTENELCDTTPLLALSFSFPMAQLRGHRWAMRKKQRFKTTSMLFSATSSLSEQFTPEWMMIVQGWSTLTLRQVTLIILTNV